MSQVSKRLLDKATEEKIASLLIKSISQCRSKKESTLFIESLLTFTERVMLAKRISVAYLLLKEVDQRIISDILRVSTGTITRVATLLKTEQGEGLRWAARRIFDGEDFKQIFDDIVEVVHYGPLPPPGRDWGSWRKEKERRKWRRRDPFKR